MELVLKGIFLVNIVHVLVMCFRNFVKYFELFLPKINSTNNNLWQNTARYLPDSHGAMGFFKIEFS